MKKLFSVLILLVGSTLLLSFFPGCKEKKIYRIGVAQCSSDDWRTKMNEEVLREAILHDDIEVEIRSGEDDSKKQIADISYFVENGFDMIIVAPNEAEALTPVITEIYDNGMPVIIFDRNINNKSYTARIGVDNVGLGENAARYSLQYGPRPLKALEIFGLKGSTPTDERHIGFQKVFESEGGEILASGYADWKMGKAEKLTDSLLKLYPETNLIFAHNDRMAIGASDVAKRIGRNDIKIIGIDAAPEIGVRAVADGKIDATFFYPTDGDLILREAIKILKGEPFQREVNLPLSSAVDMTNADILLLQNETLIDDTRKLEILKGQLDDYWARHTEQTLLFYAVIVILLLLFGFLFLVLRTFWQHKRHQAALMNQNKLLEEERDKQKELNEKLEEATQSKLVFFTNVSHDLRTPLTLISEPVAQLKKADNLTPGQQNLMKIADKNVKILERLINQILDFRKYENNHLDLNLTEIDLRKVIKEWLDSFTAVARKRDIKLSLIAPPGDSPIAMAIDVEKIERVFFNLISNAFKYSPDNSSITVRYLIEGNNLILKVTDTGQGISERDLGHIFDRFFQVSKVRPKGSGIGLSLAQAFVELHGGTIKVESELKKGTEFTVVIPVVHISDTPEEVENGITNDDVNSELEEIETEMTFTDDKPLLLVIDDNQDIREMVTELMKSDYNIIRASNGNEGIRKAVKYVPDLIICDVMMPGMDGMECCRRLKDESVTSHIPILMLTACTLDEQRVQGFDSGADGYIGKPFSSSVLKAQAASLIANRKRIKDLWKHSDIMSVITSDATQAPGKSSNNKEKVIVSAPNDIDNEFYNRFLRIFEKKMGNPDVSVETLASEMGFERTQFYRKIKAITNYSPVELIRNLRLKRARLLIKTTDRSVSEICYEVGFSNPAYFTKCYREMFGETPSETRASVN